MKFFLSNMLSSKSPDSFTLHAKVRVLILLILLAGCSTLSPPSRETARDIFNELRQTRLVNNPSVEYLDLVKTIDDAEQKNLSGDVSAAEKLYSSGILKGEALREKLYDEEQEITTFLRTPSDSLPQADTQKERSRKVPFSSISSAAEGEKKQKNFSIEVSISKRLLTLYEKDENNKLVPIHEYSVGTVAQGVAIHAFGKGTVTKIDFKPFWYPTEYTREIYRKKGIELPKAIPPGNPLNYMGAFKIVLSHKTSHGAVYRIHGNNNRNRVGKRVTGGCICMDNEEGLELARMISVGTEVNIVH